jgi:hypothetical protein
MYYHYQVISTLLTFYPLPNKGNYPRHLSGMLPGGLLHVLPANYQELPENSPKKYPLAIKRVTGNGENATKCQVTGTRKVALCKYKDLRKYRLEIRH